MYPTSRNPNPCLDNSPRISTPPPVLQSYTDWENRSVLGDLATRMLLADGSYILDTDIRQLQKQPQKLAHTQKWRIQKPFNNIHTINLHLNSCHVKFVSELDRNSSMLSKVCPVSLAAAQRSLSR